MIRNLMAAGSLALVSTAMQPAFADQVDPSAISINDVFYGGNGCPQGSVDTYISDDAKALTLVFDQYAAEKGPGIPLGNARKFCNVGIDLRIPHGWQYTLFKVDYEGYADLERGVRGLVKSQYKFSGTAGRNSTATFSTYLSGPLSSDYLKQDDIGIASLVWSPCGVNRALNIKTEARLMGAGNKSGLLTVDTLNGEFEQIYALQWRRCR